MRVLLIGCVLSACGKSAKPAPARDAAPATVPLEVDGEAQPPLAADTRLWELCDRHAAAWIQLRGPKGSFVHGECAMRDAYDLVLVGQGGQLRARDGVIAASVTEVLGVEIVSQEALASAPKLPPLMVAVDGAAPVALEGWLGRGGDGGGRKRGTELAKIVELAGVPVADVESVVIRAPSGDYAVEPAWLTSDEDEILLRYNNRGEIRIRHHRGRAEVARRNAPTVIEIRRAR